jgi:hypothetical protein
MVYCQSPANAVLELTRVPSVMGQFFKGTYHIDMIPQTCVL